VAGGVTGVIFPHLPLVLKLPAVRTIVAVSAAPAAASAGRDIGCRLGTPTALGEKCT
jgi:hypothetical protein